MGATRISKSHFAGVEMLVFDDVIVFLQKQSNQTYTFFSNDKHEAVLELKNILFRERADDDQTGIYLIVQPPSKTDLYEIRVSKSREVPQVVTALNAAKESAVPVRRVSAANTPTPVQESKPLSAQLSGDTNDTDEWSKWEAWQAQLNGLFGMLLMISQ